MTIEAGEPSKGAAAFTTPLGGPEGPRELPDPAPGPFEMFGLEPAFEVDEELLRRRLTRMSRWLHPDYFSGPGNEQLRALAEHNSAELNAAHDILSDDYRRADWLVSQLKGPDQETERAVPQAFLMEVLEWSETLEEAADPDAVDTAALDELADELGENRKEAMKQIGLHLTPLPEARAPALTEARRGLNVVRYIDRALGTVKTLRLERAKSR